jgi:hypothetical protein
MSAVTVGAAGWEVSPAMSGRSKRLEYVVPAALELANDPRILWLYIPSKPSATLDNRDAISDLAAMFSWTVLPITSR